MLGIGETFFSRYPRLPYDCHTLNYLFILIFVYVLMYLAGVAYVLVYLVGVAYAFMYLVGVTYAFKYTTTNQYK